jgi:predicted sugar kinase
VLLLQKIMAAMTTKTIEKATQQIRAKNKIKMRLFPKNDSQVCRPDFSALMPRMKELPAYCQRNSK